jgi:hypothetical protein
MDSYAFLTLTLLTYSEVLWDLSYLLAKILALLIVSLITCFIFAIGIVGIMNSIY